MESITKNQLQSSQLTSLSQSHKQTNLIHENQQVKNEPKKFGGVLNFINEKLSQWPLWIKTNLFNEQKSEQISQKQGKQKAKPKIRKALEIIQLPKNQYLSRGLPLFTYNYYHNKQDGNTYFYPFANSAIAKQIFQAPEMDSSRTLRKSWVRRGTVDEQCFYIHHIEPVLFMKTNVAIQKMKQRDQQIC